MSRSLSFTLTSANATADLAARFGAVLRPGDVILLSGSIGAGKTHFARALIQSRMREAGQPIEDVPSPTFTLVQTYAVGEFEIWHADLYRLSHPDEVEELGLTDAFETAICLVEWPDRLGDLAPKNAISLTFEANSDDSRDCVATGPDGLIKKLETALSDD